MISPEVPGPASARAALAPQQFLASVLRLEPRIALFDCDGTLWDCDSGAGFFYWELDRGMLPNSVARWARARYEDYKAGRVDEETMCGEMVTMNEGIEFSTLERAAEEYFAAQVAPIIFPEMVELTGSLAEAGCQMWAISSTADWVVRAGVARFGIPAERVIAASVQAENGRASNRLIRVPTDEGKAVAVRELVPGTPDVALGNSIHDAAMLEMARHAFAIKPNPDLEQMAREKGWSVYFPGKPR